MIQLRSFVFLDSLQPQLAAFTAATARGYLPVPGQASLWVEIAPGMAINRITDVARKQTRVRPGVQVVERAFGVLEVHDEDQAEVRMAGERILQVLELSAEERLAPRILTCEVISRVAPQQAMLINRRRSGNLLLAGQTLLVLEVQPAAYVVLAANEAEKHTPVALIDVQPIGAFGRLYLAGSDSSIAQAVKAIQANLANVCGQTVGR